MFYTRPAFQYYFMPAFFVITGFCSIFEGKSFGIFVYKNFKILILPGFFVSIGTPIGSHLLHCDSHLINYWIPVRDFFIREVFDFWLLCFLHFSHVYSSNYFTTFIWALPIWSDLWFYRTLTYPCNDITLLRYRLYFKYSLF